MKRQTPLPFLLLLTLVCFARDAAIAQSAPPFHVTKIVPFDKVVPGQILEIQIEGLGGTPPVKLLSPEDFQVEVTQDGVKQPARVRLVLPTMSRERNADGTTGEMKGFQNVSFVVPHGLHPGPAELALIHKGRQSDPIKLTIIERPLRPVVGGPAVITMSPASLPTPAPGTRITDLGWRFERDSTVQLFLKPLVDPDDPAAAILVRFKQGAEYYEAAARVIYEPQRTETSNRRVAFLPPRDFLQIEIPPALQMGPADMEIKIKANNTESDPNTIKVQIADTTRSAEGPIVNAPRLLAVTPRRVGAGQALMLSVDYLRTLNPDPSQTLVSIERDNARYFVKPERNTALRMPGNRPDAPVMVIVRVTSEIIGPAQVRVLNSLKGDAGGTSAPISIEIVDEAVSPEITGASESTDAETARLRDLYELQRAAGQPFKAYDPASRYLTIRGRGMDPNPKFVRIVLEQNGQTVTLAEADVSLASTDLYIVKLPATSTAGKAKISMANVAVRGLSMPATMDFELSH